MIVFSILNSILTYHTIVSRMFLLIFVFGLLFLLIRGGKK